MEPEEPPPWTVVTAGGVIVGYVVAIYIFNLITMAVVGIFIPIPELEKRLVEIVSSGTFVGLTNSVGDLLVLGLIYLGIEHLTQGQESFSSLVGLKPISPLWLGVVVGHVVMLILLFEAAACLLDILPVPKIYLELFNSPVDWAMMSLLLAVSPVVEEILFRGILYPAVAGRYGVWIGIAASTTAHGAIYIMSYGNDWAALLRTFVMGASYTLLRASSKSTWPGIVTFTIMNTYLNIRTILLL